MKKIKILLKFKKIRISKKVKLKRNKIMHLNKKFYQKIKLENNRKKNYMWKSKNKCKKKVITWM
jgi:hypothetical protein